jgi:hypothetical protein
MRLDVEECTHPHDLLESILKDDVVEVLDDLGVVGRVVVAGDQPVVNGRAQRELVLLLHNTHGRTCTSGERVSSAF